MRILKLVIWDLDETILTGVLEEGDEKANPKAEVLLKQLSEQGVLQALATQNPTDLIATVTKKFDWSELLVWVEADLGPKIRKVRRILAGLEINPLDVAFVDEDPFERDSIAVQIPEITTWSIAALAANLADRQGQPMTTEALRRPQLYREQQQRLQAIETATDYTNFLRSCHIQITIRPYSPADAARTVELLTRTHRMNLGVLPVEEAVARLSQPGQHYALVAEMKDIYGDMGRCGMIHLTPTGNGEVMIDSLAISCRTRARGLSQALFVGLLRHPNVKFQKYFCRYRPNGSNRPLRMLLLSVGFKPQPATAELILEAKQLATITDLPDWVQINYQST